MEAMRSQQQSSARREGLRGQVVIIFALASVVLVGMLALAIDVGMLLAERRQVQNAADAGAVAAANAYLSTGNWADAVSAGKSYGSENAEVPEDDVDVNDGPTRGRFVNQSGYIEVVVTKEVESYFLRAIYGGDWSATASAVTHVGTIQANVALLALDPEGIGIHLSVGGGSGHITVDGGAAHSNSEIRLAGSASLISTETITASDGIYPAHVGNIIDGAKGENGAAPIMEDPLIDLAPPVLPSVPGDPIGNVSTSDNRVCGMRSGWNPPFYYEHLPGSYPANGGSCALAQGNQNGNTFYFRNGNWNFGNGSRLQSSWWDSVVVEGGNFNFTGSNGGMLFEGPRRLDVGNGNYRFLNGAKLRIVGSTDHNVLHGGTYYFSGGGGIEIAQGPHHTVFNPGTYIFDGGPGLVFTGNNSAHFNAGYYEFWFANGADFMMMNSAGVTSDPGAYVVMHFYGSGNNPANMELGGNAHIQLPGGQYYFDNGSIIAHGSTTVGGNNIFLYFTNGGRMHSTGNNGFGFTAPTTEIYPGYIPGVFLYSDRDNEATFSWETKSSIASRGIVYIPSGAVTFGGDSSGVTFTGMLIAKSFSTSGNTRMNLTYENFAELERPKIFLVD